MKSEDHARELAECCSIALELATTPPTADLAAYRADQEERVRAAIASWEKHEATRIVP
jgi:hypothetical protein